MAWGMLAIALAAASSPMLARGQRATVNPTAPQAVISHGGHSGEVRSLVFTETEAEGLLMLSAGLDKVVHVWTLGGGRLDGPPRLVQTLRPPIYRGPNGSINAIDLSPPDAEGRRLLAIGGLGVQANPGDMTLMRFPGLPSHPTGEVAAVLREGYNQPDADPRGPSGHTAMVTTLRFHPRTSHCLASGSRDGTVRLWNLANLETPRTFLTLRGTDVLADPAPLRGGTDERVEELAFSPDGKTLIVCVRGRSPADGGTIGLVRVWDVSSLARPRLVGQIRNPRHPDARRSGAWVNPRCLAISPDGRWVFVGQENGLLLRFERTDAGLVNPVTLETDPGQGPVEGLACHTTPDGPRLLSSIIGRRHDDPSQPPPLACDIDLWPVPAPGEPAPDRVARLRRIGRADGRVRAVGFSPDGHLAAFGGSDAQGLYLRDLTRPDPPDLSPDIALEGMGRAIWDVRFTRDGQALGFSRIRAVGDAPPPDSFEGFALTTDFDGDRDRMIALGPDGLQATPTTSSDGRWAIRPRLPEPSLELAIVERETGQERCVIRLDPERDGRWWCFGFIPPAEGHPEEVVAVGCDEGVGIYRPVDDGAVCPRVRLLAGHSGPVLSLAPSPDGRWLATGSADQTIRLWPMDGRDRLPPLGAILTPQAPDPDGIRWLVSGVQPGGFADQAGMQDGDGVLALYVGRESVTTAIDHRPLDAQPPGVTIQFLARRKDPVSGAWGKIGESLNSGYLTTRRDRPALTLFPGVDREWIAWTPQGFYQSSIRGDTEYLAWHRNRSALGGATDIDPFDAFAAELRRPDVLTALVRSADPVVAMAQAEESAEVAEAGPPPLPQVEASIAGATVPAASPVVVTRQSSVKLDLAVTPAAGFSRPGPAVRAVEVLVNSRQVFREEAASLARRGQGAIAVPIDAGLNAIAIVVEDDQGHRVHRGPSFAVFGQVEPRGVPRLRVLSIGVNEFADREALPSIRFAEHDAERVGAFLERPNDLDRFPAPNRRRRTLLGEQAGAEAIEAALRSLVESDPDALDRRPMGAGDSVFVFANTHFLDTEGQAGAGLAEGAPLRDADVRTVSAAMLAQVLGELAGSGCKVILLLDLHHDPRPASFRRAALDDWIRNDLYRAGVVVFLASNAGPSHYAGTRDDAAEVQHGAFALGLLRLFQNPDAIPSRFRDGDGDGRGSWTLDDFQRALSMNVRSYSTDRRQAVGYYKPRSVGAQIPIFDPPDPVADRLAQVGAE